MGARLVTSFEYVEFGGICVQKVLNLSQFSLYHYTTRLFPPNLHLRCTDNPKVLKHSEYKAK